MREPSPAFQLYPDRLLADPSVAIMDPLEAGIFFRLYCHAWLDRDGLPLDERDLAALASAPLPVFRKAWKRVVSRCFEERDGRLFFPTHEIERKNQEERRERLSKAGKKGARQLWNGDGQAISLPSLENGQAIFFDMAKNGSPSPSPSPSPSGRETNVSLPPAVEGEFSRFVAIVAASNKTGAISVGRVESLRREVAERMAVLGPDAMLYGLREAVMREKPVLGYAIACAKGYSPEKHGAALRPGRSGSLDGSIDGRPQSVLPQ